FFPSELPTILINEAKLQFENSSPKQSDEQAGKQLLYSLNMWAEKEGLLEDLTTFMAPMLDDFNVEEASPSQIRNVIKEALDYILKQREATENIILQEINWNGDFLTNLHDFQVQINGLEKEKAEVMTSSFIDFKEKLLERIQNRLTNLLQDCADLVKEDSDFSNLHVEINEEMNRRIAAYMETRILPRFTRDSQKWLETCESEFQECQTTCSEFGERINEHFREE